jgi:Mn2+/Fe2+ NRAMP family transporter
MYAAILITAGDVFFFMFLEKTGIRVVEATFGVLIAVMGFSFLYIVNP